MSEYRDGYEDDEEDDGFKIPDDINQDEDQLFVTSDNDIEYNHIILEERRADQHLLYRVIKMLEKSDEWQKMDNDERADQIVNIFSKFRDVLDGSKEEDDE